jgi:hypothetical protein
VQLEILVEEPSAAAALDVLVPRIADQAAWPREGGPTWSIRRFNGRHALLRKLPDRLRSYAAQAQAMDVRVLVLIDRDDDDCLELKQQLEDLAVTAGLSTRATTTSGVFGVCNRIAVEELEAWFIGDPDAVRSAYPRVPASFGHNAKFRKPDEVTGGTWESLERLLRKHGYHRAGLGKIKLATDVARHMDPSRNASPSFTAFCTGLTGLVAQSPSP